MGDFVERGSMKWNHGVLELAYEFLRIAQCRNCGMPRPDSYVCPHCRVDTAQTCERCDEVWHKGECTSHVHGEGECEPDCWEEEED